MFSETGTSRVLRKHAKTVDLYSGRFASVLRTYRGCRFNSHYAAYCHRNLMTNKGLFVVPPRLMVVSPPTGAPLKVASYLLLVIP